MLKQEPLIVCPQNRQQWREWLHAHHAQHAAVWLVYYKKTSATPTLTWSEAVDEALCFGWIDSQAKPLDAERYQQFFSRRKPKSGWSKVNKNKVQQLTAAGQMMPAWPPSQRRSKTARGRSSTRWKRCACPPTWSWPLSFSLRPEATSWP